MVSKYSDLCHNVNSCYNSISEADWAFCLIVAEFINTSLNYNHKHQILEHFFQKDRPDRAKKARRDYVDRTIQKALHISAKQRFFTNKLLVSSNNADIKTFLVSNKNSSRQEQGLLDFNPEIKNKNTISKSITQKSSNIDKNSVLKICNTMRIFHLGKSVRNIEYVNNKTDNHLKATIPYSLNQTDFRYYMQLLFQYVDCIKQLPNIDMAKNQFFPISINLILSNSSIARGGRCYKNFLKSLNKLADVTLEYDKKIGLNDLRHVKKESLLSYDFIYRGNVDSTASSQSTLYKKLTIKMHPIVLDIVKESTYNYALLNRHSYDVLKSDKLKLLYYHFCLLAVPGESPNYCLYKRFIIAMAGI